MTDVSVVGRFRQQHQCSDDCACSRVLRIAELARGIFFSLECHDAYHAALVCLAWSSIAKDAIWYELDSIRSLLWLLVPWNEHRELERDPEQRDWDRIEQYTKRVRKLVVTFPLPSFLVDVVKSCPRPNFLPNMWSLKWGHNPSNASTFLHKGVREFIFELDFDGPQETKALLSLAAPLSGNLKMLDLSGCNDEIHGEDVHPVDYFETELSSYLAQLESLERLCLPQYWLTSFICGVLGQLPHLDSLETRSLRRYVGNPLDTMVFQPTSALEVASHSFFPSLTQFDQCAPFSEITKFLTIWPNSYQLTRLALVSQIPETPNSYLSALGVIADRCPNLTNLKIASLVTPYYYQQSGQCRITLGTLFPLQRLTRLTSFTIRHALPLALSDEDFRALVAGWSHIKYLTFACDPYLFTCREIRTARCTIVSLDESDEEFPVMRLSRSVKSLRELCPRLQSLSIYGIDDFSTKNENEDDGQPLPFPDLRHLSFGTSHITSDLHTVVELLSQYVSSSITFRLVCDWGGDESSSYLRHLNLHHLRQHHGALMPDIRSLLDTSEETPSPIGWYENSTIYQSSQPVGAMGLIPGPGLQDLKKQWETSANYICRMLRFACAIREDERTRMQMETYPSV